MQNLRNHIILNYIYNLGEINEKLSHKSTNVKVILTDQLSHMDSLQGAQSKL